MREANISQACKDLIYLLRCAVHGRTPDAERVAAMEQETLFRLAKSQSVAAMTAMALERCGSLSDSWKQAKERSVRKSLLFDIERGEICAYMEENGIWHMPLKGVIIKELYPKLGMREMVDNDILYDASYQDQLCAFMTGRGYSIESVGSTNQDVYLKPPVFTIELHTALFFEMSQPEWAAYYKNIRERMLPDVQKKYAYHLSDEDFYVYTTLHTYKHHLSAGTGIRSVLDNYVFLRAKGDGLDWAYIERECGVLGSADFERRTRVLAEKLFAETEEPLTAEERHQLEYCFSAGTYGSLENRMSNDLRKLQGSETKITFGTKLRYCLRRIFPTMEQMKHYSPMVKRHPWTYPLMWVVRPFRGLRYRGKEIRGEIKRLKNTK